MPESNDSKNFKPSNQTLNSTTSTLGRQWVNRNKENEIPADLNSLLTLEQQVALDLLSHFGWCVWFVRRSPPRKVIILQNSSEVYALLTDDGNLDMETEFPMRADD